MEFEKFIYIVNLLGVIAFAASGVFKGIKYDQDFFGVSMLGIVTSVGGGITRDVLLNRIPLVLINPQDVYLAIITTACIYLPFFLFKDKIRAQFDAKKQMVDKLINIVLITNALGLSLYIYVGARIAMDFNLNTFGIVMMATITAVGGGVIRDILANEIPFILKEDIYALLAVIGGFLYKILIIDFSFTNIQAFIVLFPLILVIRLIVIIKKINLPR